MMHFYPFNIGDYLSHTRHLTDMEDLAYRRLLDVYYLAERPLNSGIASVARQVNLRDFEAEVEAVLHEFFVLSDDGWVNSRADEEIARYRAKIEQASKAGKVSAERRFSKGSTDVQLNKKQETRNNSKAITPPDGVSVEVWNEFVTHRKAKKARVTPLVIDGIAKQAAKAGWTLENALKEIIVRNWQSFNADWVKDSKATYTPMKGIL
jgi:uncharacterized protein YdaU (DUF1376 family)